MTQRTSDQPDDLTARVTARLTPKVIDAVWEILDPENGNVGQSAVYDRARAAIMAAAAPELQDAEREQAESRADHWRVAADYADQMAESKLIDSPRPSDWRLSMYVNGREAGEVMFYGIWGKWHAIWRSRVWVKPDPYRNQSDRYTCTLYDKNTMAVAARWVNGKRER